MCRRSTWMLDVALFIEGDGSNRIVGYGGSEKIRL